MTRIIQPEIEFVNEKLQELLDSGCSFGLEGGTSVHFRSPVSAFLLSPVSDSASPWLPAAASAAAPVASPPQPEHEGGFNPHNQPVGSVARPKAALHSKLPFPAAALPKVPAASPPQPEYEGGFNPHNQPVGFVARPKAALLSKSPPCKPVTIASRVRAIYARVRVSRWRAWITYLTQGEEIR